jgi:serine protease AprX
MVRRKVGENPRCRQIEVLYSCSMNARSAFISIQFTVLFSIAVLPGFAQTAPGKYWVQFTDKNNSPYSLSRPEEFLSWKCIERRDRLSLGFDALDLPVNQQYIDAVLATGPCTLHHKSKWFNAITINTEDSITVEEIRALPFVAQVRSTQVETTGARPDKFLVEQQRSATENSDVACDSFPEYGVGWRQIEMVNGQWLHTLGYLGEGVDIAQFDAGWSKADQLPALSRLRDEGRIKMVKDFVFNNDATIYGLNSHGTYVLSIMASWLPGQLIGTAPEANYYLFRTEDPFSEFPVEEDNWVAAAEMCDSLGIDVINSSLGYSEFDDPSLNHTYADMDGNTAHSSIAADIAARKGIIIANSAGNSGNSPWHYITAPSDADDILCVGAVDANEEHASFSGYGPSSDGQVKPTVSAMGLATAYAALDSTIATGNGTSFSSPVIAGVTACLFQAYPNLSSSFIIDAIKRSASLYETPNDALGYGIPNFYKAWQMLQVNAMREGDFAANAFPNPFTNHLNVTLDDAKSCAVQYDIYDASGRRCHAGSGVAIVDGHGFFALDDVVQHLPGGHYTVHIHWELRNAIIPFQKI